MTKKLEGKVALITGASRGIGATVAESYAREGAHVVLLARGQRNLEKIDDRIKAFGGSATLVPFDLTEIDQLEALGPLIDNKFGKLDIFVANAGILGKLTPVSHSPIKDWKDAFTTNVLANVQLIRTLDPLLKNSKAGRAIFVGSGLGIDAVPYYGSYGMSKAAVIHLARTYAAESEQSNLRVNIVRPGAVDTAMLKGAFPGGYHGADLKQPEDLVPLFVHLATEECQDNGRIFTPDDIQA
ncbi:MAG: oxidoreductase [Micavibrio aeruginosavorus]|uniref:Oxidoreductase n=1 Tax=Micavibrio aeruginosavorus TaxID=349221 RepID=A0A2W5HB34_9BACT|nr:MAG: oxidoreductase [Micavibrio aeruginosavorus]